MAVENSDFVHAACQVVGVSGVAEFAKNVGFLGISLGADDELILELEQRIDREDAFLCVTPSADGYVCVSRVSANGRYVYVWAFNGSGEAVTDPGIYVVVYRAPSGFASENDVPNLPTPSWSGGGGGGPPSGPAGGDLGGTYPDPTVVAAEVSGPVRVAFGAIADGDLVRRVGTDFVGMSVPDGVPFCAVRILADSTIVYAVNVGSITQYGTGDYVANLTVGVPADKRLYVIVSSGDSTPHVVTGTWDSGAPEYVGMRSYELGGTPKDSALYMIGVVGDAP